MQPQKIDAERAGLKLTRPAIVLLVALAAFASPSGAQGPGPVGFRQAPPTSAGASLVATNSRLTDTTRVKPNQWKRGARIGFVAVAVPVAALLIGVECEPLLKTGPRCAIGKTVFTISAGVAGALVGGFIGSFFPKGGATATGN